MAGSGHDGRVTPSEAHPRPPAFWADARFLLGIVLIVGSVAGVWAVVAAARQTVPALAAVRTIVAGEEVAHGDVEVVDVALGPVGDAYLAPAGLAPGSIATRTIGEGELVAASAVGAAEDARTTTVVVRSASDIPAAVTTGTVVEVWAAPLEEGGAFGAPRVLVANATVLSVVREQSVVGSDGTSVELVVDRGAVAGTLAAIAGGSRLALVPSAGGAAR